MRRNVTPKGLYFDIFNFSYFYRYKSLKNFFEDICKTIRYMFFKTLFNLNERLL